MEVVYPRCCGLDVHKKVVVACCITPGPTGVHQKEARSFGTMTEDLLALADWLTVHEVTHVAMEAHGPTGSPSGTFWKRASSCCWSTRSTSKQLRHGLLKGSFVPDRPQRELRELTRYRTSLVQERSARITGSRKS